jgi:predicted short-subunit dehydrogenase-like oxidoreductase (DUF2520 family)
MIIANKAGAGKTSVQISQFVTVAKERTKKRKPTVSIIGPGRVGQALAIALDSCGYSLLALAGRPARPGVENGDELQQLSATDLILITTPDDAIAEVAQRLAARETGRGPKPTVLHTSGALSSEVLSPLAQLGFHTGSLHPLVSISEARAGAKALRGALYCLEGDKTALQVARLIVQDLKGKSFSIRPESKALYHAAAVMASPHLVALFDLATEMLAACGVSQRSARQILLPLVESTVNNLLAFTPDKALTGTFARGDVATVRRHLEALKTASLKQLAVALEVYKLLGLHSLGLAVKNGLDPKLSEEIRNLLKGAK